MLVILKMDATKLIKISVQLTHVMIISVVKNTQIDCDDYSECTTDTCCSLDGCQYADVV